MAERQSIRLGLAGLNQTPLDWHGNMQRIRQAWQMARQLGVRILCLPELAISSYGCEDRFLHPDTAARALTLCSQLAGECGDEILLAGLPVRFEDHLYNGVAVLHRGRICGITLKHHLARDGIHYEPRWFRSWPMGRQAHLDLDGQPVPIGHLVYRAAGLVFAIEVCEDAWVADNARPCRQYGQAAWVFNASASHFSIGKADIREELITHSSKTFAVGYGYTNLVGCESGRAIYDGELLVAENGAISNRSKRLYLDDCLLLAHDFEHLSETRGGDVLLPLGPQPLKPELPPGLAARQYQSAEEEFARAASLALLDYLRKSRSRGFTLSLSGGVDSSTVAVLVWVMAQRMCNELNAGERQQKLHYLNQRTLQEGRPQDVINHLLTTVYQATRNSGPTTRNAASGLAEAIGARHLELDVDALVMGYRGMISQAIGRPLDWEQDDVALQNIQARVRGPGVWMLANLDGNLLLTTSNRSEVAVGYATMDGDTCGGLAPIAGVEKTFLRHWLRHMEIKGLEGIDPLPVLALVNRQEPTAELRPHDAGQSDEQDLMPYEVLDALEELLIANRQTPLAAWQAVSTLFEHQFSKKQLQVWTAKFCRLFAISQWKRERYAPAFHLDDRNLDPKTWARYPILSGSFAAELEELERAVRMAV